MSEDIQWHNFDIKREHREKFKSQKACVIWMTGLSGSGKSSIANTLEQRLIMEGYHAYILDGDNVRHGLNQDLGFSKEDRQENNRRVAEVAKLFVDAGLIIITSFISPLKKHRDFARSLFDPGVFYEVLVDCDLKTCQERDPKGLYKKARAGKIKNFTGIDAVYEKPSHPEVVLDSSNNTIETMAHQLMKVIKEYQNEL